MKKHIFAICVIFLFSSAEISSAGLEPSELNQRIRALFSHDTSSALLMKPSAATAGPVFYKSATPLVLQAKAHPEYLSPENRFILSRPTTDTTDLDYYGPGISILSYLTPHFRIYYTEDDTNGDAPDSSDGNPSTIPQFVLDAATELENSYAHILSLGYTRLPGNNGAAPVDIFILHIHEAAYGYTTFDFSPLDSYIVINNSFAGFPANLDPTGQEKGSLKVTIAHELFHCFQFQYSIDVDNDGWWMETSSTWMEDEVYPEVKDYLNYIGSKYYDANDNGKWDAGETYYKIDGISKAGTTSRSTKWFDLPDRPIDTYHDPNLFEYGDVIFAKYLSENMGKAAIKNIWLRIGGNYTAINAVRNIVSSNATFDSVLRDFRKKVLGREFVDSFYYPLVKHEASFAAYPQTVSRSLNHLSAVYYAFKPIADSSPVNFAFSGMNNGLAVRLMLKRSDGGYDVKDISLNSGLVNVTITDFGKLSKYSKIVVAVMNNSSTADNKQFSFTASLDIPAPSSSGGGGGGCFIATAAYGSYLSPEVTELRKFRDEQLMTNVAGRSFVKLYYIISPPFANIIRTSEPLKAATRLALSPVFFAIKHPMVSALVLVMPPFVIIIRRRRIQSEKRRRFE